MNRLLLALLASVGFLLLPGAGKASAQMGGYMGGGAGNYPYGQQRVSPYLNLLRGTNMPGNLAANYYGGTQTQAGLAYTQQMFSNQIRNLQGEVTGLAASDEEFPTLRGTGHMTAFGNTGSYFSSPGSSMMMQMRYRQILMRQFPQQRSSGTPSSSGR